MPRYRPPKITRDEAAAELQAAYDEGYAAGLAGLSDWPYTWNRIWEPAWTLLEYKRRQEGCRIGYQVFRSRVRVAVNDWPTPSAPPTSDGDR